MTEMSSETALADEADTDNSTDAEEVSRYTEELLKVENVSLSFGGVNAITDISFNIMKGEVRAIIGPNGAGKTSMLNVINGFYLSLIHI